MGFSAIVNKTWNKLYKKIVDRIRTKMVRGSERVSHLDGTETI